MSRSKRHGDTDEGNAKRSTQVRATDTMQARDPLVGQRIAGRYEIVTYWGQVGLAQSTAPATSSSTAGWR